MAVLYEKLPQIEREDEAEDIRMRRREFQNVITISSLVTNVVLLASLAFVYVRSQPQDCVKQISSYSPVFRDIEVPLHAEIFNGTLFPNSQPPSIWREPPNPEVDAVWTKLAETPLFAIPRSDVVKLRRDPDIAVKVPVEWNLESPTGEELYLAQLDGQHTLHCLNTLRKYAYFEHYYGDRYQSTAKMPLFDQTHLNHCVDMLRQNLMCQLSTDIITFEWREAYDRPHPMFSIEKMCRDYDGIFDWVKDKNLTLTMEQGTVFPRPAKGVVESPASSYWLDLIEKSREAGVPARQYIEPPV